jgi:hypothetical protein
MMDILKKKKDLDFILLNSGQENDGDAVYSYIGRFVMSRVVIDEMGGYPFYDSPERWWLVVRKFPAPNTQTIAFSSFSLRKIDRGVIELMDAYVVPKFRNKGIFREMLRLRMDFCMEHYPALKKFEVLAMPSTQDAFLQCGFTHVSTRGRWWRMLKEVEKNATD